MLTPVVPTGASTITRVADSNVVVGNRRRGPSRLGLPHLLLDQAAERPGIPVTPQIEHGPVDANRSIDSPFATRSKTFVSRRYLHGNDLAAVLDTPMSSSLDAEEQIAAQALNRQLTFRYWARLSERLTPEPILEPGVLGTMIAAAVAPDERCEDDEQSVNEPPGYPHVHLKTLSHRKVDPPTPRLRLAVNEGPGMDFNDSQDPSGSGQLAFW